MAFMRFFDLLGFDSSNSVAATKKVDMNVSRSNYLYLLSKYNQKILKEKNYEYFKDSERIGLPEFFKSDLKQILNAVENGGDFETAKNEVIKNCLPEVKSMAAKAKNDRELIELLNEQMKINAAAFAKQQSMMVNNHALTYIINNAMSKQDSFIESNLDNLDDPELKSKTFKKVIEYNALAGTIVKVANNELSVSDFIKQMEK